MHKTRQRRARIAAKAAKAEQDRKDLREFLQNIVDWQEDKGPLHGAGPMDLAEAAQKMLEQTA